jgi:hypothetical protein
MIPVFVVSDGTFQNRKEPEVTGRKGPAGV